MTSTRLFATLCLAVSAAACSSATTETADGGTSTAPSTSATGTTPAPTSSTPPAAAPGPGAFAADYKTSPAFFTTMATGVKGTSPHGTSRIWYSSNAKDVITKASFTVPEGTTSIKEFDMDGDGKLDGLAVMIKKPAGYDAANGDWYYDMRSIDGTVMPDPPAGKIAMCIGCHEGFKAKDYLGGTSLK